MQNNNIITIVAHPTQGAKDSATQEEYLLAKFLYNTIDDTYECPQGETLKTTGDGIKKRDAQSKVDTNLRNTVLQLVKPARKHLCTSRTGGREIDRSEYAAAVEENNKRYQKIHNCIELGRRLTNISLVR
jgi:hypothetical protein